MLHLFSQDGRKIGDIQPIYFSGEYHIYYLKNAGGRAVKKAAFSPSGFELKVFVEERWAELFIDDRFAFSCVVQPFRQLGIELPARGAACLCLKTAVDTCICR